MKKLFFCILTALMLIFAVNCLAADVLLKWDAAQYATGYKLYISADNGVTWDAGIDVGNVTQYTYLGVPDTGLQLFRVSAYNQYGETITAWAGSWFNGDWIPPTEALGLRGDIPIP